MDLTINVFYSVGVYDEKTDEITKSLLIIADAFDEKTLEVLGNEPLVVLS